jgi:hypothetical protein
MGQNPDFYVTPTSGVLELVYAARQNYTDSPEFKAQDSKTMEAGYKAFCSEGFKAFYSAITDKKYVVDKSRGWGYHYNFLNFFYENPKIIVMVRDLRDITASMEKNYRKHPEKASFKDFGGHTVGERVTIWLTNKLFPVLFCGVVTSNLVENICGVANKYPIDISFKILNLYPFISNCIFRVIVGLEASAS